MSLERLQFIDTHCHIHDAAFSDKFAGKNPETMITEATQLGVEQFICVGTDSESSRQAVAFCRKRKDCLSSIAYHPHEASKMTMEDIDGCWNDLDGLMDEAYYEYDSGTYGKLVVAIGECGLDYFYHSDENVRRKQKKLLEKHFELAIEYDLPLIFHVRDAFSDFFEIFDQFDKAMVGGKKLKGVVHSFSASVEELEGVLKRGLFVGLNGIMTFTKDQKQLEAAKAAPLERIVLETDAPFLTPAPFRGKMCEPKHVVRVAEFLSDLRGESLEEFARTTTANARRLFDI